MALAASTEGVAAVAAANGVELIGQAAAMALPEKAVSALVGIVPESSAMTAALPNRVA